MTPDGPEHVSSTRTVATGLHAHDYDALEHARFAPGQIFASRYRIISILGRGAMGEVYRADDLKLGQPIALKFLPTDFSREPTRIARFTTEVRLARQISHPNVCRVYDIGESDGRHYLSIEYPLRRNRSLDTRRNPWRSNPFRSPSMRENGRVKGY
jgi:serine/threonine protein kinase